MVHMMEGTNEALAEKQKYVVYCHGGSRAAVAALVLSQNQYDVVSLQGGLRDWEFELATV